MIANLLRYPIYCLLMWHEGKSPFGPLFYVRLMGEIDDFLAMAHDIQARDWSDIRAARFITEAVRLENALWKERR